jgi:hypothetical protein
MTVRVDSGVIQVEGRCPVDDAERLFIAIREHPSLPVDIHQVEWLHMAVAQVLLALKPELRGKTADLFLAQHIFGPSYAG